MRSVIAGAVLALAVAFGAPPASAQRFTADDRETLLLSRSHAGGFPDGASRNGALSQDRQRASYAAFESDATNIVAGDVNGVTDVFLVARARPYSLAGEPWVPGRVRLVSTGLRGAPANGPSTLPDLGGDQIHPARCIAFISAATNLVPGDTNGLPDAFVHDLRTGRTTRVSVATGGAQAKGSTYEVEVDGACGRVAFVSDAPNLALIRSGTGAQAALRTSPPPTGTRQVYVRVLGRSGADKGLTGTTFLASASDSGRAGNANSEQVSFSRLGGARGCSRSCGATAGEAVAFASDATNLAGRADRNRVRDVYVRSFARTGGESGTVRPHTVLVSRTPAGAGNGPSDQPDIGDNGAWVAYRTQATDLLKKDDNGLADVVRANAQNPGRNEWVSRSLAVGAAGDGASAAPTITRSGSMTFFESDATNLQSTVRGSRYFDRNNSGDIFFFAALSGNVSLQSRDSANDILNNDQKPSDGLPTPHTAARRPAASYYGNYVVWESAYPLIDLPIADTAFPGLRPREAAARSLAEPVLGQVYLRYIGPA